MVLASAVGGRRRATSLASYRLACGHRAWRARVTAYGKTHRFKLGEEPTLTEREARVRLDHIADQIAAGGWAPPRAQAAAPAPLEASAEPTFHQLCEEYVADLLTRRVGAVPNEPDESSDDRVAWRIERHLLPKLGELCPSELTPAEVQKFRDDKVRERRELDELRAKGVTHNLKGKPLPKGLGPSSVNKLLTTLYAVLDRGAVFHDTADSKRLRLANLLFAEDDTPRDALGPEQTVAALDAARELDDPSRRYGNNGRMAFIGCLALAGLRITEACDLDLGSYHDGQLHVREYEEPVGKRRRTVKTRAGIRRVDVVPALAVILNAQVELRRSQGAKLTDPLMPTHTGARRNKDKARQRVFDPVMARARRLAAERGLLALPDSVVPHTMRRTFATQRTIVTRDPSYVARQLGHRSAQVTMDIYDRYDQVNAERRQPSRLRMQLWGDQHDHQRAGAA